MAIGMGSKLALSMGTTSSARAAEARSGLAARPVIRERRLMIMRGVGRS
jgi:hypothetical protein